MPVSLAPRHPQKPTRGPRVATPVANPPPESAAVLDRPGPRKGRFDTAFRGPRFVHPRQRHRRNPFLNKDFRMTSRYSFNGFVPFLDTATDDLDINRFLARLTSNRVDVSPNAQHRLRAHRLPALPRTFATNLSRNSPVSRRPVLVLLYTIEARKPRGVPKIISVFRTPPARIPPTPAPLSPPRGEGLGVRGFHETRAL